MSCEKQDVKFEEPIEDITNLKYESQKIFNEERELKPFAIKKRL